MNYRGTRFWHTAISKLRCWNQSRAHIGLPLITTLSGRTNVKKILKYVGKINGRSWQGDHVEIKVQLKGPHFTCSGRESWSHLSTASWQAVHPSLAGFWASWHRSSPASETKKKHDSETKMYDSETETPRDQNPATPSDHLWPLRCILNLTRDENPATSSDHYVASWTSQEI